MIVNNSNFILEEVPNFHPLTQYYDRMGFWRDEKRKCIEGYWQSGKWMPGPLYYYVNFNKILFEDDSSVAQSTGLPWLRDIDWELFYLYEECRGFSGFVGDTEFTCDRKYGPEKELAITLNRITIAEAASKTYIPAREYLRKNHGTNLGKPLYKNTSKHFISIQSRGGGKSYSSSAMCTHNFLFDGATDYDDYLTRKKAKNYTASDTIIGAIDTKYTGPVVKKVKTAIKHLPGSYKVSDDKDGLHPSPLLVSLTGSLAANKEWESKTGSLLRHRTFKDNPLAANGTRPNFVLLDEIGFMSNVKESWGAIEATQASKQKKNLVIWALGTGGLISGKAALYAESIFRNPEEYNCLVFDDEFENRGTIGYFVPYSKTLNEFKSKPDNITIDEKAKLYINHRRELAKKSNDPSVYQTEIINGPMLPSEAFLVIEGSYFPTLLLKEQLAELEGGKYVRYVDASWKGHLHFDEAGEVEIVVTSDVPIRGYPLAKNDKKEGCVEIWVKPQRNAQGVIPFGTYIGGMDVVDKAKSTTSSLPSIFIMNRYTRQIVAEYTGRTDDPNDFYEICRKLLLYYNATGMYEQNLPGLFTYFERKKSLYLLSDTPSQLRNADTYKEGTNTSKGINASAKVNTTARDYIKSWLLEKLSTNSDDRVLSTLYSSALVRELLMWNPDGNFDRVSALGMVMWHDATMYREIDTKVEQTKSFLDHNYFKEIGVLKETPINTDFDRFKQ